MSREGQRVGLLVAILLVLAATLRASSLGFGAAGVPTPTVGVVATGTSMPSATPTLPPPTSTATPTITPTATLTPTVTPTGPKPYTDWARDQYGPPWEVNCDNENPEDGYIAGAWALDFCVPGFITRDAYWYHSPDDFYGLMSSYAPGVMEAQLKHRGIPEGAYKDGVALMSCNEIGEVVWLRRPEHGWDGPFIVVDCSAKNHMYYHMVGMGLAVEVGFKTTERWGAKVLQRVDVHIGSGPPGAWSGVYLPQWWVHHALKWEGLKPTPAPTPDDFVLP